LPSNRLLLGTKAIRQRLRAQLLSGTPARDPSAVAERLLAIQAQDPRGARLTVRARSRGLTAADVDRALDGRELLVATLNRGTLHLVRSEDYAWLHALTTPPVGAGNARRLAQEGVSPRAADRAVARIERTLADDGPLTRAQLQPLLRLEGQALAHVLMLASLRAIVVRGPMVERQQAYVLVRDWLGRQPRVDRDAALAELARRYLAGHAPADERDLAKWAGLPLRDVRAGLSSIAGELVEREDGLLDLKGRRPAPPLPPPRLLGAFDPLLHGWVSREAILGSHKSVVTTNGLFRPFALADGRAVAIWSLVGGKPVLESFDDVDVGTFDADAADVVRFLG
jgi:hypothetical protein